MIKISKEDLAFIFEVADNGLENEEQDERFESLRGLIKCVISTGERRMSLSDKIEYSNYHMTNIIKARHAKAFIRDVKVRFHGVFQALPGLLKDFDELAGKELSEGEDGNI